MSAAELRAQLTARVGRLSIDVELEPGPGTLVVVGPNGAGKSSLLRLMLGLIPVLRGRIEVGEAVLLDTARNISVPVEERRLGYVPQDYALFPHLTVRGNVDFAVTSALSKQAPPKRRERVDAALAELGLEAVAERRPTNLSGGERQRVALARALAVEPRALLLDEPLAALDVHARREVREFLAATLERLGLPTIVVTHDPADAALLGRRIAVLEEGRVTRLGTWQGLATQPGSRFVEEFVAAMHVSAS